MIRILCNKKLLKRAPSASALVDSSKGILERLAKLHQQQAKPQEYIKFFIQLQEQGCCTLTNFGNFIIAPVNSRAEASFTRFIYGLYTGNVFLTKEARRYRVEFTEDGWKETRIHFPTDELVDFLEYLQRREST